MIFRKLRRYFVFGGIPNEAPEVHAGLRSTVLAVLLLGAVSISEAQATSTQHVTVDLATPKAAVQTMFAAVEMADGSALRDCFYAPTDAQRDLVTAYADLIVAARHLRDAARDKFAADNAPAPNPAMVRDGSVPGAPGPEDQAQLAGADVQVDGDTASVQFPDRSKPIKLKRSDNLWRIDLADYAAVQPSQLGEQTEVNHSLAAALEEASQEITAGKYASAQEAESAVQQKIHNVIAPQLKNLTTAPTTRPAG